MVRTIEGRAIDVSAEPSRVIRPARHEPGLRGAALGLTDEPGGAGAHALDWPRPGLDLLDVYAWREILRHRLSPGSWEPEGRDHDRSAGNDLGARVARRRAVRRRGRHRHVCQRALGEVEGEEPDAV